MRTQSIRLQKAVQLERQERAGSPAKALAFGLIVGVLFWSAAAGAFVWFRSG